MTVEVESEAVGFGDENAGSGGGAAGRIRINTTSGAAMLGASTIVSPAITTMCTTQGTIGK